MVRQHQGLTLVHFSAQPEMFLVIDPAHRHRVSHKTCLRCAKKWTSVSPWANGQHLPRKSESLLRKRAPRLASSAKDENLRSPGPWHQGLTLVHFSAQLKRLLCDRGCS
jgi:hypothetical protein